MTKTTTNIEFIALDRLEENIGQLNGLPANPRTITDDKLEKLKKNLAKYPQLLEMRSLLVYPLDNGNYIIIGGNMRLKALRAIGEDNAPCIIIDKATDIERLKALTVLDNASFGKFDYDKLANEWEEAQLEEFGVDIPNFTAEPLDGLFQNSQSASSTNEEDAQEKIIVTIPKDLEDDKNDILKLLQEVIDNSYDGCKVEFKQ